MTRQVIEYLFALCLFLLLIALLASVALVKIILKPIHKMQQRASEMLNGGPREALPVPEPDDELKALAMTLNGLLDSLHDSLSREKQLVADVSHELRTPLSIISLRLEKIRNLNYGDKVNEEVENLFRVTNQMTELVSNLLFLARVEKPEVSELLKASELESTFLESIDESRILAASKEILIEFNTSQLIDISFSASDLRRVLINLVSNAINASPPQSTILLSLKEHEDQLVLLVVDEGVGFSPDFIKKAFERFSRSDESRSKDSGGTGLGLALVKAITDRHGAQIKIGNRDSGGARVEVTFRKATQGSI